MIYEPLEDSFLLQKDIKKHVKHNDVCLDMGTGSGIQAEELVKYSNKVYAFDKNPDAIKYCKEKCNNKIHFFKSDLFSALKSNPELINNKLRFDIITFNPPYLPDDPRVLDMALDGGKHGYELIERFLNQAPAYLKPNGKILLLFSSYSNQKKIEEIIQKNCLIFHEIDKTNLDFEKLYIYLIEKSQLLKDLEKRQFKGNSISSIKFLAKGHRGIIFTANLKNQKITIKAELPSSKAINRMENEVRFLKIINKLNIGPVFLFSGHKYFVYKYVKGDYIIDYIKKSKKNDIIKVIKNLFLQLYSLDKLGINKFEMHHPKKHILIDKKPVLIDFERARFTEKPHNVTQFCQFISQLRTELGEKDIIIDPNKMQDIAQKYRNNNDIKLLFKKIFCQE